MSLKTRAHETLPVSLIGQWCQEARSKLKNEHLKIYEYHGPKRIKNAKVLAAFDLVVTTFETIASDCKSYLHQDKAYLPHSSLPRPAVLGVNWFRLILDESHRLYIYSTYCIIPI